MFRNERDTMKKISVIIPCYNATKWLPKCFMSLVEQTMGMDQIELIFVDDASTDEGKTWEMLLLFEQAYPDSVIVIHLDKNQKQGGARNAALSFASGEYISFVDADDWVKPELYEIAYQRAKAFQADLLQFNHCLYSEKTGVFDNKKEMEDVCLDIQTQEGRRELLLSERITYGCWNKLYKRTLIEASKVRFAEHKVYEEPLFVYPLLYYGKRFAVIPDRLYIYRQNAAGTMYHCMERAETLKDHAKVQYELWNFMKHTVFFKEFYEEIKMYFLHTFFYETIYFAKLRGMEITMESYRWLEKRVLKEVPDLERSAYEHIIPCQMRLYRLARNGMTEQDFKEYLKDLKI